jgi:hypothetical protein
VRSSRLACAALASLNVLVAAAGIAPRGGGEIAAIVPSPPEAARAERPRGETVIFRPRGERPASAARRTSAIAPRPSEASPVAVPIDRESFAYLGTMTAADGTSSSFFKDRAADRVYASGTGEGEPAIIEATEKEFLIELNGTKFLVAR